MSALALLQTGVLLALVLGFLLLLVRLFRPGAREEADRAAAIPFRDDREDAA
ncbi:CcoQ/FixQ family Cbb3-type cytochrome c oxidase assembly chaperone [Roseicella aquatilis]|uniref:CcoQ/FixQ family Cbb3-type cytochrome c oxidase assembly chaperone n=1 Tax=Roseicella aquatilis TaxID=2527868 RepID=UPI00198104E9|nr:CcoQ/FixQ family Cbb3-type cytochrome c oxidase assembly chaperone [Roseicella aquatilis]